MLLKNYQKKALENLLESFANNKKILFVAPTGSGKTYMISNFIQNIFEKERCVFFFLAPKKLERQAYKKLKEYNGIKNIMNKEEIMERYINPNSIVFLNWNSIKSHDNLLRRETETYISLQRNIENLNKQNIKIHCIIDEQQTESDTEKANVVLDIINPNKIIYMTATPTKKIQEKVDDIIIVSDEDVMKENMIRKIRLNYIETHDNNSEYKMSILSMALNRLLELKKAYDDEKENINPLMIIQIPTKSSQDTEIVLNDIFNIMGEFEYERFDSRVRFSFLDGNIGSKFCDFIDVYDPKLSKLDSKIDILIVKDKISEGWDVPRAQILVSYRPNQKDIRKMQTIGRIRRNPKQKIYNNDILNYGYVYMDVVELKTKTADFIDDKVEIKLKDIELIDIIKLKTYEIDKISLDVEKFTYEVKRFIINDEEIFGSTKHIVVSSKDIDNDNISHIVIEDDHINKYLSLTNIIKKYSHVLTFEYMLKIQKNYKKINISKLKNILVDFEKTLYDKHIIKPQSVVESDKFWTIPEYLFVNNSKEIYSINKYTHKPCKLNITGEEKKLIYLLDSFDSIKYIYKNKDNGNGFWIPYRYNKKIKKFYPDFIIVNEKNDIIILEHKGSMILTNDESKEKFRALDNYCTHNGFRSVVTMFKGDMFYTIDNILLENYLFS